jgi:tetratricopeptide (TPR) repeat protein
MARARHFAEKALELDPQLATAHSVMGGVRLHADWDFEGAEEQFLRALDLDPGSVLAHQQYATLLSYSGRFAEAIEHLEIARDLDPLTPDPGGVGLGYLYEMQGEPERAVAAWTEKESFAPS